MISFGHGFLSELLFGDRMIVLAEESDESEESYMVVCVEEKVSRDCCVISRPVKLSLGGNKVRTISATITTFMVDLNPYTED